MRITAYSLVPSSPMQYVHLGYLAAGWGKDTSSPAPFLALMVGCLALALLMKRWVVVSGIFLLLACVSLTGLVLQQKHRADFRAHYRENGTRYNAELVLAELSRRAAAGDRKPVDDLAKQVPQLDIRLIDGWTLPWRLRHRATSDSIVYTLTSRGPDFKFDTADDMVFSRTVYWPTSHTRSRLWSTQP